jgi:hypothetical protein
VKVAEYLASPLRIGLRRLGVSPGESDLFGEFRQRPNSDAADVERRVKAKVAEILRDFAKADDGVALFAAIDQHREARKWLRGNRQAIATVVEATIQEEYARMMAAAPVQGRAK